MTERPWQIWLFNPPNMTRDDGDRLLEKAGYNSRLSFHATEAEAKAAGEEVLRKLKEVDDTQWTACYAEPYDPGTPGKPNYYPTITSIHSCDVADRLAACDF